jgi:hypothetical protein
MGRPKSVWMMSLVCILLVSATTISAKTPDQQTPAQEGICDNETVAKGLCIAACEAIDCGDPNQRASNKACATLQRNFERKTGRTLPCMVTCPCPGLLQLFGQIVDRDVTVTDCIQFPTLLYIVTEQGDAAFLDESEAPSCSVNAEPPFVTLNPAERGACKVALIRAVESQGIFCRPPE